MARTTEDRRAVERYVARQINKLQDSLLLKNSASARALLARLRSGLATRPGDNPDTWEIEFDELPESLKGTGDMPATAGEWAVHLALGLYATHQQSQQAAMYCKTDTVGQQLHGFGTAVRKLANRSRSTGQGEQLVLGEMPRRFKAMVTSESIEELAHYARQIVTQFRGLGIPIDYGRFAGQIFDYQNLYRRDSVRLEWAREFSQQLEDVNAQQDSDELVMN